VGEFLTQHVIPAPEPQLEHVPLGPEQAGAIHGTDEF
jgi:hypothetical protein